MKIDLGDLKGDELEGKELKTLLKVCDLDKD